MTTQPVHRPGGNNKNWESVSVNNGNEAVDVTQYTDISKDFSKAMDFNEESNLSRKPNLIVSFGEMLIDFVPSVSGVSLAEAIMFKKAAGGAPANVAVAIAKLGGFSAFIGKVGEDEFGHHLVDILKENGVLDQGICYDTNARTALAFVTLRRDGEREFMFHHNPSADMLLTESELDTELIRQASIFHYGSISLIAEPCRSAHLSAMKIAKDAGALLSYDPNLRLPLWSSSKEVRKGILSIWDKADLIKLNEDEVAFITNGQDYENDEVVMSLWHPELKLLIITEGQKGCRYYTKAFRGRVGSIPVKTVDTTGAGDAYTGAFLTELVKDMSLLQDEQRLREALRFANLAGAITTTEKGAIPALPDRAAIMNLLNQADSS